MMKPDPPRVSRPRKALATPRKNRRGGLAARLRGRAPTGMGTDEILQLTRGDMKRPS